MLARLAAVLAVCLLAPAAGASRHHLGDFRVTYYHVAVEDQRYLDLERTEVLLDAAGCELARTSPEYRRRLDLEGTGRLADGRMINVAFRVDGAWRYIDLGPAHYGLGAGDVPLVPFVSVAADPRRLPRGSRLWLPAFAGAALPDGSAHGGRFIVDDVGSAIQHARLDIFIGDEEYLARFEAIVPSHGRTAVYRIDEPAADLLLGAP